MGCYEGPGVCAVEALDLPFQEADCALEILGTHKYVLVVIWTPELVRFQGFPERWQDGREVDIGDVVFRGG